MRLHENTLRNHPGGKIFHFKDMLELFGRLGGYCFIWSRKRLQFAFE
ncbi:MAG: hypothetical protein HFH82_09010 [Lachnospiraceae bacterium]|nr:hypothetical protein [Lachnospiraceae bacterium]